MKLILPIALVLAFVSCQKETGEDPTTKTETYFTYTIREDFRKPFGYLVLPELVKVTGPGPGVNRSPIVVGGIKTGTVTVIDNGAGYPYRYGVKSEGEMDVRISRLNDTATYDVEVLASFAANDDPDMMEGSIYYLINGQGGFQFITGNTLWTKATGLKSFGGELHLTTLKSGENTHSFLSAIRVKEIRED